MSLQDESFPADELLDKLTFSPLPLGQHFQLPPPERCESQQPLQHQQLYESNSTSGTSVLTGTATNSSNFSSSVSSEQNLSTDSQNGPPPPALSTKTSASQTDGDQASKRSQIAQNNHPPNKAGSFQDIHSEYTKRRFRHVASKVAEYIASIKAEDLKRHRRMQLERHRSMPDTLSASGFQIQADVTKFAKLHFSTDELHRPAADAVVGCSGGSGGGGGFYGSHSDGDDGDIESAANTSVATSNANNNHKNARTNCNNNNHSDGSHETSNDTNTSITIDKQMFVQVLQEKERIQSYSEYLQTKLDDKITENMRLKRNVDYLRIELTSCQDKLKQKEKPTGSNWLALLHQPQSNSSKATQTDSDATTSPVLLVHGAHEVYATPDTPDANNNKTVFDASTGNAIRAVKTVATIQPLPLNFSIIDEQDPEWQESGGNVVLRQRTNSFVSMAKYKANNQNKIVVTNNNTTNKQKKKGNNSAHLLNPRNNNSVLPDTESSATLLCCSPRFKSKQQPLMRNTAATPLTRPPLRNCDEEFFYYEAKHAGRQSSDGRALNESSTITVYEDENVDSAGSRRKSTKKHNSLRRRWLRFLGSCTRCSDPQHTLDNSSAMQTYTQIPLLEKSYENHCRNVR